jgi:GTPase SAR1 family protein
MFMLVFDVTKRESFEELPALLEMARQCTGDAKPTVILVATKTDLGLRRTVTSEQASAWAKKHAVAHYFETSAVRNFSLCALLYLEKETHF